MAQPDMELPREMFSPEREQFRGVCRTAMNDLGVKYFKREKEKKSLGTEPVRGILNKTKTKKGGLGDAADYWP